MTTHPIDTEALAKRAGHILFTDGPEQPAATARETCVLLDLLAAAEHRATRAEAQSAIRGRAVVIYQQRARTAEAALDAADRQIAARTGETAAERLFKERAMEAEARIKAVRELHGGVTAHDECEHCRRHTPCPTICALA